MTPNAIKNILELDFHIALFCKKKREHQAAHLMSNITQRKHHLLHWKKKFCIDNLCRVFFPGFSDIIERHLTRNDLRLTLKRRHKLSLCVPEFTVAEI